MIRLDVVRDKTLEIEVTGDKNSEKWWLDSHRKGERPTVNSKTNGMNHKPTMLYKLMISTCIFIRKSRQGTNRSSPPCAEPPIFLNTDLLP